MAGGLSGSKGLVLRIRARASSFAPQEKNNLRRMAREYYKKLHPEFAELLEEFGDEYPIHHRRPMEYAHLLASEDINAASNFAMVQRQVHTRRYVRRPR